MLIWHILIASCEIIKTQQQTIFDIIGTASFRTNKSLKLQQGGGSARRQLQVLSQLLLVNVWEAPSWPLHYEQHHSGIRPSLHRTVGCNQSHFIVLARFVFQHKPAPLATLFSLFNLTIDRSCGNCSNACPKALNPGKAIQQIKRDIAQKLHA